MSKSKCMNINIAGFRKTSLIDYPDHIATVIFTQGCNCRCPYCHNPGLIPDEVEKEYMDLEYFQDFLKERQHLLDGVVITGGEPTLQEGIIDFIDDIKSRNMKIKLDTNGSNFQVIAELMERELVDYLAVDFKTTYDKYQELTQNEMIVTQFKKCVSLILNSNINHEFRTTVVPGLHTQADVEEIAETVAGADKYCIQNFRPDFTLDSDLEGRRQFPESKLEQFKEIAAVYVEEVEIRN